MESVAEADGTGGGGIGSLGGNGKPGGRNCEGLGNAGLKLGGIKLAARSGFIIDEIDMGFAASPLNNDNGSDIFAWDKSDGFVVVFGGGGAGVGVGSTGGFFCSGIAVGLERVLPFSSLWM